MGDQLQEEEISAATIAQLAEVPGASGRRDPVSVVEEQALTRDQDLIPVRHARMSATPFTFYRGAAAVMTADLAATPDSGIHTQLCGDAHLSNFGVFYTRERRMIFDINDFDETHPGPFEWDVKRLAASVVIAGRNNGFKKKQTAKHARAVARYYRNYLLASVELSTLDCWYARIDVDNRLPELRKRLDSSTAESTQKMLKKARHRDSMQAVSKLCWVDDAGRAHIRSDPPLLVPLTELATDRMFPGGGVRTAGEVAANGRALMGLYRASLPEHIGALYDQFDIVDVARKVVGVGSVGLQAWVILMWGKGENDPLMLQVKQAQRSVLADYVPGHEYAGQGWRVIEGQQVMQAGSDQFLGAITGRDIDNHLHDYYVRQLRDGKGSVVVEALGPKGMKTYAALCGRTLGRAHARTASRHAIAAYLDGNEDFDEAITEFALSYAAINDSDHAAMIEAIASGRIEAAELV
ncbi:DUF2252 domain-containing protein [Gordonia sp. (in: high G+C Gram-positive bacteria)]|uniref:DUF2252 domain-containing protein n=1 Tax=Gordonia sp. (in: high G+C Gram-positive bacteria) TaxID=84139 RepID=UPI003FA5BFA2